MKQALPSTSSAVPVALTAQAGDVAEILADSRAGCLAPVGAVAILALGAAGAVGQWVVVSPTGAQVYMAAVVVAAFAWALLPSAIRRRRATLALRARGLSTAQIRAIRAVAQPIVRARGGGDPEGTKRAILAALLEADLFAPDDS